MQTNIKSAKTRVALGAAWLDRHDIDWFECIDTNRFDISNECRCVLGQIAEERIDEDASFWSFIEADTSPAWARMSNFTAEWTCSLQQAVDMGFDVADQDYDPSNPSDGHALMEKLWKAEINKRVKARAGLERVFSRA